jgi:arylsulfatase A-like enzyme
VVWASVFVVAVVSLTACQSRFEPPQRVFLFTIDTLRVDHLGAYGYPRGVSPFIDQLAENSVVFDLAVSSCSHTAPSHASIFTSLQPAQHRVLTNGEQLDPRLVTIAEVMGEAGYRTGAFTPTKFLGGLDAGFEHFSVSQQYEPATAVLERASAWFDDVSAEEKSFAWIHLFDVHEWNSPRHVHDDALQWVKTNARLRGAEFSDWLHLNHGVPTDFKPAARELTDAIDLYDGQLYALDRALAAFFADLEARGWLEGSLVILTADHGEGLGNHRTMGHGIYIYDEQIRVPLLVWAPDGRFRPHRVEQMVRLVDLAPTLAEMVGAKMDGQPIPIVGSSLAPLLAGRAREWKITEAFSQRRPADQRRLKMGWAPGEVFSVRGRSQKLIINTDGACEAFDLVRDPFELHNQCEERSTEFAESIAAAAERFNRMQTQGEAFQSGLASPEVIEELKALGYL